MRLTDCHNFGDFRRLAKKRLPGPIFHYIDGAADDEVTYRRNTQAFEAADLVPNVDAHAERVEILAESADWLHYDLPAELVGKLWKGRYRGQTQKWFAMRFLGEDADIDIETEEPEFSDWQWAAPERLPELIVHFKRDLYRRVLEEFRPLLTEGTTL